MSVDLSPQVMVGAVTASGLIYVAMGRPAMPGTETGVCRLCGLDAIGEPWAAWVKDTFTDHDKIQPGTIICHACLACVDDHSAVLQARTGRDKPQRMRNYSHLVTRSGRWIPAMKNQKRAIAAALLDRSDPPVVAVISLTGQKHLILRARVGWWQIEESALAPQPDALARMLEPITALYTLGATKQAIETGQYSTAWLRKVDLQQWAACEQAIRPVRGSLLFQLAVWLTQKPEEDETHDPAARTRGGAAAADLDRHQSGLQGQVQDHDLAAVRGRRPQRGLHDDPESLSQPDLFAAGREPA